MKKAAKIWLIAAAALILLGLLLFAAVMTACGWDFGRLSTDKYESSSYEIHESFSSISIKTDTADICFEPSLDGLCKVLCLENENEKHAVAVQDDALTITAANERKWYTYIGISFGSPKLHIYLPENAYTSLFIDEDSGDIEIPKDFSFESMDISTDTGDVKNLASVSGEIRIQTDTGHIYAEGISADTLALSVSTGSVTLNSAVCENDMEIRVRTGDVQLCDVRCGTLRSSGSTGDIRLKNVLAAEEIHIERSTGDVAFEDADAAELFVETDTGDVSGSLCSEKMFLTESNTGDIRVPASTAGGTCRIITSTGDITITVQ